MNWMPDWKPLQKLWTVNHLTCFIGFWNFKKDLFFFFFSNYFNRFFLNDNFRLISDFKALNLSLDYFSYSVRATPIGVVKNKVLNIILQF